MNLKEAAEKSGICLTLLTDTAGHSQCGRDTSLGLPEYEAGLPTTQPLGSRSFLSLFSY